MIPGWLKLPQLLSHSDRAIGQGQQTKGFKPPQLTLPSCTRFGDVCQATFGWLLFVRPAGRTYLEVQVLYSPGKGKS